MRMYMYSTRSRERPRRRWIKGVTDTLRLKNTTGFQITRHAIYQKAIINKKSLQNVTANAVIDKIRRGRRL